ncbi:hypothetical protein ADIARSV_0265 [Arcticibacter svalbardensis MN12-7]|uniref:Uncharacterized protein n=1 Tax=Arcticibacter svalbardensis MN12-7 TaxID=1150600 RepID=R9GXQ6_9SPHI|nr:hypothetical protein [Arcticibacter svalbardensis]EOR96536.1 hypothetical protein ADIARSV_0265 [Arcticibacter svalbardensis MN12-7]
MKTIITVLVLIGDVNAASAQLAERTNRFPVGTFHKKNLNINGISAGLYSGYGDFGESFVNVHTNGIRLEAIGMGVIIPLLPSSPISESEEQFKATMSTSPSEKINGFNLSSAGTICDCTTNGVSAGAIGQISRQVNGVSVSFVMNMAEKHNGIQLAMVNESFAMNGIQLGISNQAHRARGL